MKTHLEGRLEWVRGGRGVCVERTENDPRGWDSFFYFGFDEGVEVVSALEDTRLIMSLGEVVECGLRGRH